MTADRLVNGLAARFAGGVALGAAANTVAPAWGLAVNEVAFVALVVLVGAIAFAIAYPPALALTFAARYRAADGGD